MNNYKINKNKSLPDDEKIRKHMDFNKVLGEYNKVHSYSHATRPFYKNKKFMGFIILLATVILAIIIIERENEKVEIKKSKNVNERLR
ncbi:MAG TPA: hypothetical protein VNW99_08930 [Cytophagaceae bacterium]|jgi:hypothetical protein|nr:hypothetical protein [Cytophagaceae bacterium]